MFLDYNGIKLYINNWKIAKNPNIYGNETTYL